MPYLEDKNGIDLYFVNKHLSSWALLGLKVFWGFVSTSALYDNTTQSRVLTTLKLKVFEKHRGKKEKMMLSFEDKFQLSSIMITICCQRTLLNFNLSQHLLTPLENKPFENTMGKGEIGHNE